MSRQPRSDQANGRRPRLEGGGCRRMGRALESRACELGADRDATPPAASDRGQPRSRRAVVGLPRDWDRQLVGHRWRGGRARGAHGGRSGGRFGRAAGRSERLSTRCWCVGHATGHTPPHAPPSLGFRSEPGDQPGEVRGVTDPMSTSHAPLPSPLPGGERGAQEIFARLNDDDLATCVHCGLCLDACPTFRQTGLETESPRGRIQLMTEWKRGSLPFTEDQARHIDLCLGCRTCEAVCPSGVPYGRIIEAGRAEVESIRRPTPKRWLARIALRQLVAHPRRLRAFGSLTRAAQAVGITKIVRSGRQLPPIQPSFRAPRSGIPPPIADRRHPVALLAGCVMPILYPQTHEAAVRLLQLAGCEVWFPRGERCCGALLAHNGDLEGAERLRDANMQVYRDSR